MRRHGKARRVVTAGTALVLSGTLFLAPATPAFAEDSELEQLQSAAIEAADAYQVAQDKVEEVNAKVAENQAKVEELQSQLPDKQKKASAAIKAQYKMSQEPANLVSILLCSDSLSDFLSRLYYLDAVAGGNLDDIDALNQTTSELQATQAELDQELSDAKKQEQTAEYAARQAEQTAAAARQKAMQKAEEAKRAYEAQQAAGQEDPTVTEIKAATGDSSTEAQTTQTEDATTTQDASPDTGKTADGADSSASADTAAADTPSQQSDTASATASSDATSATSSKTEEGPAEAGTSSSSSTSSTNASGTTSTSSTTDAAKSETSQTSTSTTQSAASAASYTYVQASWYGEGDGFMYCMTASGDYVTPTSMGVAMKTMPLGTIIEITYNGKTVTAVVNDRGPYVGNRQIDLQPAVAHALGFTGVGTVGYRVVG